MLDLVSRYRKYVGRAGAILCALVVLTVLDGLTAQFRHPLNLIETFPGHGEKVNGPLRAEIDGVEGLKAVSESELIRLSFQGLQTGFWLGQRMWRGVIEISPQILPGSYGLTVTAGGDPGGKPLSDFTVRVYRDLESYRRNAFSLCVRYLGISPWYLLAGVLPVTFLAFGGVYLLSRKEDELLAGEGKAEIYRVTKGEWGFEIAFGLGSRHGIRKGSPFALLDEKGRQVAAVTANHVSETDATAQVGVDCEVRPGYTVRKL